MRSEESIRNAIKDAEEARDKSTNDWEKFFEEIGERPVFTNEVRGVTLNCAECQEFDSFIRGLRYALGELGDENDEG